MQDENYVVVQGWMVRQMGLKGNELLVYAVIYGFSQSGVDQKFTGSLQYLADWTNSTKQGVIKNLKSLQEKGYIEKEESVKNGVKFCDYRAVTPIKQSLMGGKKSLPGGIKQSLPHNIDPEKKEEKKDLYSTDPELEQAIRDFLDYRKKLKKPMTDRAIAQFMKRLEELAPGNPKAQVELINTALEHGWMTVYPAKDNRPRKQQKYNQFEQRQDDLDALMSDLYG